MAGEISGGVARPVAPVRHQVDEVLPRLRERLFRCGPDEERVEQRFGPPDEQGCVFEGQIDQLQEHPRRKRTGDLGHEIAGPVRPDLLDCHSAVLTGFGLNPADRAPDRTGG